MLGVASVATTQADPIKVRTSLESEYSDNIKRESEKVDDVRYSANVGVEYQEQTGVVDTNLGASLSFETYQNDTYSNDVVTQLDWLSVATLMPNRLTWRIQDNLSDTQQNSTSQFTPDNRERRNYFVTGPSYILPVTTSDSLQATAEYARTDYEKTQESDTYRGNVGLNLLHVTPSLLNVNWLNNFGKTYFDDGDNLNKTSTSLQLSRRHQYFIWTLQAGYAKTKSEEAGFEANYDGFEGSASLDYTINSSSRFNLYAAQEMTDTSSEFAVLIFDIPFTVQIQEVVKMTVLRAGYDLDVTSTDQFNFKTSYRQQDFQASKNRETNQDFSARWNHRFTNKFSGYLYGTWEERKYTAVSRTDHEQNYGLGVSWRAYHNLAIEAFTGFCTQDSDDASQEFDEFKFGASVVYYPRWN